MTAIARRGRSGWGGVGLVALGVLSACSGEVASPVPDAVAVDLVLDPTGLRVAAVRPAAESPLARDRDRAIGYRLEDAAGTVLVHGRIGDFRRAHAEFAAAGGADRVEAAVAGVGHVRLPSRAGTLVLVEARTGVEIGRTAFDPAALGRRRAALAGEADVLGEPVVVAGEGEPDSSVDLLFLPEGYLEDELPAFHDAADAIARDFLALAHYSGFQRRFTIKRQDVRSNESGIDDPDAGLAVDTAFDVGFGEGDFRRCIFPYASEGNELARTLGEAARADVVVVLANTTEYGGCAQGGLFTVSLEASVPETMAHELGHAMLGLADEYPYGTCVAVEEPPAANVTLRHDAGSLKWSDLLTPGIALPTPTGNGGVGAFEGGNYCEAGVYRPSDTCLMRELGQPFCAVCARERDRFFENFGTATGAQLDCPPAWRGDGICDLCMADDPDCGGACDDDGVCDAADGENCESCAADCGTCPGTENSCDFVAGLWCGLPGVACDCEEGIRCGDGECAGGETDRNCSADCGCAALGQCDGVSVAPYGCYCDPACGDSGDCCADVEAECGGG